MGIKTHWKKISSIQQAKSQTKEASHNDFAEMKKALNGKKCKLFSHLAKDSNQEQPNQMKRISMQPNVINMKNIKWRIYYFGNLGSATQTVHIPFSIKLMLCFKVSFAFVFQFSFRLIERKLPFFLKGKENASEIILSRKWVSFVYLLEGN